MSNQPIIIKKSLRQHHDSHGGAWKIAYADFVTAMMAFFLLLWLLNAVTQEQLEGISDYFSPISTKKNTSGGGGLLAGKAVAEKGVFEVDAASSAHIEQLLSRDGKPDNGDLRDNNTKGHQDSLDDQLAKRLEQREENQFRRAQEQLSLAIQSSSELKQLARSLLIDETVEGLRIQIIDQAGLPMFPRGSSEMYTHTRKILELVTREILQMPQDIDITGHTDATKFVTSDGYSNWELSADRANAARRILIQNGLPEQRIARIAGKAATDPLLPDDPEAPGNRRLTLVLLRGTGDRLDENS